MRDMLLRALFLIGAVCLPTVAHAQSEAVEYYHTDVVGTVRLITNASGQVLETFDYLPFGEAWPGEVTSSNPRRFAGKERDTETGLDYFGARYYSNRSARFTTVDPVLDQQRALVDPQQWNRYAYARNNPVRFVDPDGRAIETPWDAFNVGLGMASFVANVAAGNVGGAVVDALGVVYDATATVVPGLPGGAGSGIRAARVADAVRDAAAVLERNAQAGAAFERVVQARVAAEQTSVVTQLTIKTQSGVRTKIDIVGRDAAGNVRLTEAKSSATARLTPNQKTAFPEIAAAGGTVVGRGKPGYPRGTQIPPTRVEICRPACERVP